MKYQHVKSLFKYKVINEKLLSTLKQGKIYAPVIEQLNDPLESHMYISGNYEKQNEMNNIFENYNKEVWNEISNKKYTTNKQMIDTIKNYSYENNFYIPSLFEKQNEVKLKTLVNKVISSYGVISFSVDNHSLLMWSHYGDSHKGICIEFERSVSNILGESDKCFPIQYSSFIKEIEYSNNRNIITEIFKSKSDVWSYEKEWRLILRDGKMLVDFPGEIKAVYFGLKTTDEDIKKIKNIFKYHIKYYKAYVVPNYYKIDYKEIRD